MSTIKAGSDTVGTALITIIEKRAVVINSLPDPIKKVITDSIGANVIALVDLYLIALESPSPRVGIDIIEAFFGEIKDEIEPLRHMLVPKGPKKH